MCEVLPGNVQMTRQHEAYAKWREDAVPNLSIDIFVVMPIAEMPDAWHDNDRHGKPKVLESCPWSIYVIYRFCSVHMILHGL